MTGLERILLIVQKIGIDKKAWHTAEEWMEQGY